MKNPVKKGPKKRVKISGQKSQNFLLPVVTSIFILLITSIIFSKILVKDTVHVINKSKSIAVLNSASIDIAKSRCLDRIQEAKVELDKTFLSNISKIDLSDDHHEYSVIADKIIQILISDWLYRNNLKDAHAIHSRINAMKSKINEIETEVSSLNKRIPIIEENIKMFEEKKAQYSYLDPNLLEKYNEIIDRKKSELNSIKKQLYKKSDEVFELRGSFSKLIKEYNRIKFIESTLIYEINDKFDYDIWSFDDYSLAPRDSRLRYIKTLQNGSTNYYAAAAKTVYDIEKNFLYDNF